MKQNTENESHNEENHSLAGDVLHTVADIANIAHFSNIHIKGPLKYVGPVAEIGSEIMHNPSGDWFEKVVCGTAVGIVKEVINGAVAVNLGTMAGVGASIGTPAVGGVVAVGTGIVAYKVTNAITTPIGNYATKACHDTFEHFRNKKSTPGSQRLQQKAQALNSLTKTRTRDNSLNYFTPNYHFSPQSIFRQPIISTRNYSHYPSPYFGTGNKNYGQNAFLKKNHSFNDHWKVRSAVREAIQSEKQSMMPSFMNAYFKANGKLGLSNTLSLTEFRSVLSSTNLMSSYNSYHPNASIRDIVRFNREIGGVASETAIIEDLINSEPHALAEEYYFCFKEEAIKGLDKNLIQQVLKDLEYGFFEHQTLPFFSLHFHNQGWLYPVVHPVYKNTLTGEIIAFLDYWMKGFLNGGVFNQDFLKTWSNTQNMDEHFLKANLINLKKHCKNLDYVSLREMMAQMGLDESSIHSEYNQPFMTSFRIIAYQQKIERQGNILVSHPDFRVEYSIDPMPDYQKYLDEYLREHGAYPSDYAKIRLVYEKYAEEIKNKMPLLPFCREFFQLLGVMNTFCYFFMTMDKMGKRPVLEQIAEEKSYSVPKSFPPYPLLYPKAFPMQLSLSDVLNALTEGEHHFEQALLAFFNEKHPINLPEIFHKPIEEMVIKKLQNLIFPQLSSSDEKEVNDSEIERMTRLCKENIQASLFALRELWHQNSNNYLQALLSAEEFKKAKKLNLSQKYDLIEKRLQEEFEETTTAWKKNPSIAKEQYLEKVSPESYNQVLQIFLNIEIEEKRKLDVAISELKENYKKALDDKEKLIAARKNKEDSIASWRREEQRALVSRVEKMVADVTQVFAYIKNEQDKKQVIQAKILEWGQDIPELNKEIQEFNKEKPLYLKAINNCNANIAQLRKDLETEVGNIPVHLRAINKVNIQNFTNSINNDIAENNNIIKKLTNEFSLREMNIGKATAFLQKINQGMPILKAEIIAIDNRIQLLNQSISIQGLSQVALIAEKKVLIEKEIKAQVEEEVVLLQKDIVDIDAILNALSSVNEETLQAKLASRQEKCKTKVNMLCMQLAILAYASSHKDRMENRGKLKRQLSNFQEIVTELHTFPKLTGQPITKNYIHLFTRFFHQDADGKPKENFKIVGGCGMSLPTLNTEPLAHGQAFTEAALQALESNASFYFNNARYAVLKLQVKDYSLQNEYVDEKNDVITCFEEAIEGGNVDNVLQASMDAGSSTLSHYAAAFLDDSLFAKVMGVDKSYQHRPDAAGYLPVHIAAMTGNVQILEILLEEPVFLEKITYSGATPLYLAVQHDQLESLKKLIEKGADINQSLPNGLFPLFIAIQNNFIEMALWIIEHTKNLKIDQMMDNYMTALHLAIECSAVSVAKALIEKGADCSIKRKSDGYAAMHCAARGEGAIALLQAMHAKKVKLDVVLESNRNILHIASETGHIETVNYLLQAHPSLRGKINNGNTALMLAIKAGKSEIAKVLATTEDVNATNNYQETASLLAIKNAMPIVSDILLERGEVIMQDRDGYDYVYYVVRNGDYGRFLALIEKNGINFNQLYAKENLLQIAAKFGHFLIVYEFMDRNLIPLTPILEKQIVYQAILKDEVSFIRNWFEENPLAASLHFENKSLAYLAVEMGAIQCFSFLAKYLTNEDYLLQNLLIAAIESGQEKIIEKIALQVGNINAFLDANQNTALHYAAKNGYKHVVTLLLKLGAIVQKNSTSETPLHIVCTQKDDYLLKHFLKMLPPSDWPVDLWQLPMKKGSRIQKVLTSFEKKLRVRPMDNALMPAKILEQPLMAPVIHEEQLQSILYFLANNLVDNVLDLIEEDKQVIAIFKSNIGGKLLSLIFNNINSYEFIPPKSALLLPYFEKLPEGELLAILKQNSVNPAHFTGKDNILLTLLSAKDDDVASNRFDIFSYYFPDAVAPLIMDPIQFGLTLADIALKLNRMELFRKIHTIFMENSVGNSIEYSGLHAAARGGNYEGINALLDFHHPDLMNIKRQTPLMFAAQNGTLRIIELLLSKGANPDRKDLTGKQALHYAILGGSEEAALLLLPLIRYPDAPDRKGINACSLAAYNGFLSIVRNLTEQKNYRETFDKEGQNALHHASIGGQTEVIEYLVKEKKFFIDQLESPLKKLEQNTKRSPLHLAALKKKTEAVKKLIDLGANIYQEDVNGNTVIEYAILSKDKGMLQLIQQLSLYHDKNRNTQMLVAAVRVDNEEVLNELILDDADINGVNQFGQTLLHIGASCNAGQCMEMLLLGNNIPIDLLDINGNTALHLAASFGHVRSIDRLVQADCDINKQNKNRETALFIACKKGHTGAVCALLKYGADALKKNSDDRTPKEIALLKGYSNIAALFKNKTVQQLMQSFSLFKPESEKKTLEEYKNELDGLLKEKAFFKATKICARIKEYYPEFNLVHLYHASILYLNANYQQALKEIALYTDQKDLRIFVLLYCIYEKLGEEIPDLGMHYKNIVAINNQEPGNDYKEAVLFLADTSYTIAHRSIDSYRKQFPEDYFSLFLHNLILEKLGLPLIAEESNEATFVLR